MEDTTIDGKSIKECWLVPQKGVNKGTSYEGRLVGNSPEIMPLYNSLNANIKRSCDTHCALTAKLHIKDPRKFSMIIPKLILCGMHRLIEYGEGEGEEGVPCSKRCIQDCNKAFDLI